MKVDLSQYNNKWYKPGRIHKRVLWYLAWMAFFRTSIPYPSAFKSRLLRVFGAKIGFNVVIKPRTTIKYPWFLQIGDNCWIGEDSWLDNLDYIRIGDNVVISQRSYLLTGNHNYNSVKFDLIIKSIQVEDGAWIGASAIITPGVSVATHSIITAGSVLSQNTEPYGIYKGNPAELIRKRVIE